MRTIGWSYTMTFGSCCLLHFWCTELIKLAFFCAGQVKLFICFVLIGLFGIYQFELSFICSLERKRFIIDDLIVCCFNLHIIYYAHFLFILLVRPFAFGWDHIGSCMYVFMRLRAWEHKAFQCPGYLIAMICCCWRNRTFHLLTVWSCL